MDNPTPRRLLDHNPVTRQKHRKEVFWQITFPIIIGTVFLVTLIVLEIWTGNGQLHSQDADVSMIWLLTSIIIATIILLLLLILLTYGIFRLIDSLPQVFNRGQGIVMQIQSIINRTENRLVAPILSIQEFMALVQSLTRVLRK